MPDVSSQPDRPNRDPDPRCTHHRRQLARGQAGFLRALARVLLRCRPQGANEFGGERHPWENQGRETNRPE